MLQPLKVRMFKLLATQMMGQVMNDTDSSALPSSPEANAINTLAREKCLVLTKHMIKNLHLELDRMT